LTRPAEAELGDSAILHVVMLARDRLRTNRQGLLVVVPAMAAAKRILEIVGLTDSTTTFETTDEALAAAKSIVAGREPS